MAKKILSVFAVTFIMVLSFSFSVFSSDFSSLEKEGIIKGDEYGLRENDPLTRAEFIKCVNMLFNLSPASDPVPYPDVPENSWYAPFITSAVNYGYINGDENGNINPDSYITKGEAFIIIGRFTGKPNSYRNDTFSNSLMISQAEMLKDMGFLNYNSQYDIKPDDKITRGECFDIFSGILRRRFEQGKGTEDDPYIIAYPFQFLNIRLHPDSFFRLSSDIDFSACNILYSAPETFSGNLDGAGFKIYNLRPLSQKDSCLFTTIENGGTVDSLTISGPIPFSFAYENNGFITGCKNSGYTDKTQPLPFENFGFIACINNGTVSKCVNTSFIGNASQNSGGVCGVNNAITELCANYADGEDGTYSISGKNNGEIKKSFTTSPLPVSDTKFTGCYYTNSFFFSDVNYTPFDNIPSVLKLMPDDGIWLKEGIYDDFSRFSGGDGSKQHPYRISDETQFKNITAEPSSHFILTNDIYFSSFETIHKFNGVLNGAGFDLTGIRLVNADSASGIFTENNGEIKNIGIRNSVFISNTFAFSLCEKNNGKITNVYADSYIKAPNASGIIYENNGIFSSSQFSGNIYAQKSSGGITYVNNSYISDCLFDGHILLANSGAISYINLSDIISCASIGEQRGANSYRICFSNMGTISKCAFEGSGFAVKDSKNSFDVSIVNASYVPSFFDRNLWEISNGKTALKGIPHKKSLYEENTADFSGGNGSIENPFKIVSPIHFLNIKKFPYASFILMNDLDFTLTDKDNTDTFCGILYGNGFKIKNNGSSPVFSENAGVILSLTTEGNSKGAALCLKNTGIILYCKNISKVTGTESAGLALFNDGKIFESLNNGEIEGNTASGIALYNKGEIWDCINTGSIAGTGANPTIYGIAMNGEINRGYNIGEMYFAEKKGKIFPASEVQTPSTFTLDFYNDTLSIALTFEEFTKIPYQYGFDNTLIYSKSAEGFPVLCNTDFSDVVFPHGYDFGTGTKDDPFVIRNILDLYNIRMYPDSNFTFLGDVDLSGSYSDLGLYNNMNKGFTPISDFSGNIDGNNCTLYSLNILLYDTADAALIINNTGKIQNLTIAESRIEGKNSSAAICISNKGTVNNITVRGSQIGSLNGNSGGIVLTNEYTGSVLNSINNAEVFSSNISGGIAAANFGKIENCANNGGILSGSESENAVSGGICGVNRKVVSRSLNNGYILAVSNTKIAVSAGIAASDSGSSINCYNTGNITSKSFDKAYSGGISGYCIDSYISNCYNIGYVSASGKLSYFGSVAAGGSNGKAVQCYYDHTLSSPAGENCIRLDKVEGISLYDLSEKSKTPYLSDSIWEMGNQLVYPYPVPSSNPYKAKPLSENVRDFAGGLGTVANPYKIITAQQLSNVRKYLGASFSLLADIDMSGIDFTPIGDNIFAFFGSFMGNGHTISNLTLCGEEKNGFFLANYGDIYNLNINTVSSSGSESGGICALNSGLIYGCSVITESYINSHSPGISGAIASTNSRNGMIVSSFTAGSITHNSPSVVAGGICGYNIGLIAGCFSNIQITAISTRNAILGGICGNNQSTISDCASFGDITASPGPSQSLGGGICASNSGSIANAVCFSKKISTRDAAGITCSSLNSDINNCYYSISLPQAYICGGIKGLNDFDAKNPDSYPQFDRNMWLIQPGEYPVPADALNIAENL